MHVVGASVNVQHPLSFVFTFIYTLFSTYNDGPPWKSAFACTSVLYEVMDALMRARAYGIKT